MSKILKKAADILFLLRLPLLAPVWTVLILGWITGNPEARIGAFSYGTLFINLFGFSFIVASIYVVNQIKDIESDRVNSKLFILPNGIVSVHTAWIVAATCAAVGLAVATTQGIWLFLLSLIGLIIGALYNLPPASLKDRAVGGAAANVLGHGCITFLVGWFSAKSGQDITGQLLLSGLLSSLAAGFANGAVFLATTIPDANGDRLAGKKTFCVIYGEKITAIVSSVLCALALAASFLIENHFWVMAVPAIISLGIFINFAVTAKRESAYYSFKWPVFILSVFVTLFIPVYVILVLATVIASRIYYKRRFGITYPTFKPK